MKIRAVSAAAVAVAALALVAGAAPATAAESDAQLSVIHGVPGTPVDVWVNGTDTVKNFQPGTMAGPLALPAGTYSVAITKVGAASADDSPVIGPVDLKLDAGGNYSAVAHLDASGKPTATLFTNDTSATAAGQGRLTVRHVAAAPAVDVVVGGKAVVSNLTNPNEQKLDLPAGTVSASVTATGTTEPALIGPADVTVKDGTNTIVYAWGSANDKNLALMIQDVDGLGTPPNGVQAGTTGAAYRAEQAAQTQQLAVGAGALALLVAAGAIVLVAVRRRAASVRG
ncbi:DUF4397 domain-containing protein [Leifsonia sp. F6_8S_P_1B]|uniref:DUF4397 domain-containing protein n=1 Tax=Leifsonia williamsii TaxID=3035919 RepID=A0ABT8K9Z8_9MICO|nr:DUF4397 domain-containing protein [Leifsonia williamsii]MDN4614280.1 DUF4397 domain-containing protein [Leifsonia williamsii]